MANQVITQYAALIITYRSYGEATWLHRVYPVHELDRCLRDSVEYVSGDCGRRMLVEPILSTGTTTGEFYNIFSDGTIHHVDGHSARSMYHPGAADHPVSGRLQELQQLSGSVGTESFEALTG